MVEENVAVATVKVSDSYGKTGLVLSNNEAIAKKGIFTFSSVLLITSPGTSVGLSL